MGRGTEIDTGITSASPPSDSPPQGTGALGSDSGFQAAGTAQFLHDAASSDGGGRVGSAEV
jgi:hypothetical protein